MAGTFGMIGSAYSGLAAARAALEVAGQNVTNANTTGYVRQRVDQVEVSGSAVVHLQAQSVAGDGVKVTGIARLNDALIDARVRTTGAQSAYASTAADALSTVETALNEPSTDGLSGTLSSFWSAWQGMGNGTGSTAKDSQAAALIGAAKTLTAGIADGYEAAATAWSDARSGAVATVQTVNGLAKQVATLNTAIRTTVAAGGNANALMDQRDTALTSLSSMTGATTRSNADGSVDVAIGGSSLVSGGTARQLVVQGGLDVAGAAANPVTVAWSDTGAAATVDGGELAARLTSLGPANASGTGGAYAEAAAAYNTLATSLATAVNAVHEQGTTTSGTTGLDFFRVAGSGPAALGLSVVPTGATGIAAAEGTKGRLDSTIADRIAQLGTGSSSPDAGWGAFVSRIGAQSATATAQSTAATAAATAATTAQTSQNGVDLDEETANLVTFQHAYQAAARVLTTIDDMLDTLINRTGRVGV